MEDTRIQFANGSESQSPPPKGYTSWPDYYKAMAGKNPPVQHRQVVETPSEPGLTPTTPTIPKAEPGSFAEWYQNNYGTVYNGQTLVKKDGMSATDYAIGQNLFYAEKTQQNLDNQYETTLKELALAQSKDTQEAAILYEKMKKYLTMAAAGKGMNVSSGDMIGIGNTYQNNLGQINQGYSAQRVAAQQGYSQNTLEAQMATQQGLYDIYAEQDRITREDQLIQDQYAHEAEQAALDREFSASESAADRQAAFDLTEYNNEHDQKMLELQWAHEIETQDLANQEDIDAYRSTLIYATAQDMVDGWIEAWTQAASNEEDVPRTLDGNITLSQYQIMQLVTYYQNNKNNLDEFGQIDLINLINKYDPGFRG